MPRPEAVIFDIGNVLIEWQPERFYDSIMPRTEREAMFAGADLARMNALIDGGADFRETVYAWAERHPRWREAIRHWHDSWIRMATPAIPGAVALLRQLRRNGVPVFALTNFGVGSFDYAQTQYDCLTEFDRTYVSGRMRVLKPDPRIYEMVEEDCGIAPDRLLFTDDRSDNITAAATRGWQVHHFDGPEGWAARLVAEGLLTTGDIAS